VGLNVRGGCRRAVQVLPVCLQATGMASRSSFASGPASTSATPLRPIRPNAPRANEFRVYAASQVADGVAFPNGMVVTPDNATLIVAESYGNRLTAFDIAADGSLSNRRVWADLGGGVPDGICLDAEGAVWYADVGNSWCVRVKEGGEVLQTIELDRGCFACMLGGTDRRTLFVVVREWRGLEGTAGGERTGQVLIAQAPAPGAGWPYETDMRLRFTKVHGSQ